VPRIFLDAVDLEVVEFSCDIVDASEKDQIALIVEQKMAASGDRPILRVLHGHPFSLLRIELPQIVQPLLIRFPSK
jgi:hypothetical protein